jgi:hypothetical protein
MFNATACGSKVELRASQPCRAEGRGSTIKSLSMTRRKALAVAEVFGVEVGAGLGAGLGTAFGD